MTAILKQDPPGIAEPNRQVPPGLERVVWHCLEKSPEQRFQSANDLAFALESLSGISGDSQSTRLPTAGLPAWYKRREPWAWIAAGVFLIGLLTLLPLAITHLRQVSVETRVIKLALPLPDKASLGSFAISPDGRWLAFTAATGGNDQLWVRGLDALTAQVMVGTEGADDPFWSSDSRSIGFFAGGRLKRIEVSGGSVQTVCDVGGPSSGGTWNRDEVIVFATAFGLNRVPAIGGTATLMTSFSSQGSHYAPSFLPDGLHFLEYIHSAHRETKGIYLGSLDGTVKQRLLGAESNARYVPSLSADGKTGYLLFLREGALLARPFDAQRLKFTGEPFSICIPSGSFSISDNGVLVYDTSLNRLSKQLVWVDRQGKLIRSLGAVGGMANPALTGRKASFGRPPR